MNIKSNGITGDTKAAGGLFQGVGAEKFSSTRSPLNSYIEEFGYTIADIAQMELIGWTETAINTPTSATISAVKNNGYLAVNPGTKADSGSSLQANAAPGGTRTAPVTQILGPLVSSTTLMDSRELIWAARVGFLSGATTWDGKVAIGWIVTDTALMTNTTGVLALATGGGFGFRISELGSIDRFHQATTAATDANAVATGQFVGNNGLDATVTADTINWFNLGCRASWVDASAGTGKIDYYINDVLVDTQVNELPMQSTQTYSFSLEVLNGPVTDSDVYVDWIVTGVTNNAGRTE